MKDTEDKDRRDGIARPGHPAAGGQAAGHDRPGSYDPGTDSTRAFMSGLQGRSGVLFEQAMAQTRMAVCLTDPRQKDDPIVFANSAFYNLTGYGEDEVIGRNCRFLQGPGTDPKTISRIRDAIRDEDVVVVEILNYRKDGTPFWNALHLGPIYDSTGEILYFFGSQWDVSDVHAARSDEKHARMLSRELSHRMKNMFSVISGIVMITGRMRGIQKEAAEIIDRIGALGRAYETTLDEASTGTIEVGQMVRSVLGPYDPGGDRIVLHGNGARVTPNTVSMLGLTLHELATNAGKHGALSREDGRVDVGWQFERRTDGRTDHFHLEWTETVPGGVAPPADAPAAGKGGMGSKIIDSLLAAANAELSREWRETGLRVTITVPVPR